MTYLNEPAPDPSSPQSSRRLVVTDWCAPIPSWWRSTGRSGADFDGTSTYEPGVEATPGRDPRPPAPQHLSRLYGATLQLKLFDPDLAPREDAAPLLSPREPASAGPTNATDVGGETTEAAALAERLRPLLDFELGGVALTRNRSTFLSASVARRGAAEARSRRSWNVRIHRCFCNADEAMLRSVALFLNRRSTRTQRRRALVLLRTFFESSNPRSTRRTTSRSLRVEPVGTVYDLNLVLGRVRQHQVFDPLAGEDFAITWGQRRAKRRPRTRRQRSVQLGSYLERSRLIRVHPVLDAASVPEHVVYSVVFHELLHALVPARRRGSRRVLHCDEFRRLERRDPGFQATERWIERYLFRLL